MMSWMGVVVIGALCAIGGFLIAALLITDERDDRP